VDTGITGAIAFLSPDGQLLAVEDMPVDRLQVGKGIRSRVNAHRLLALLRGAAGAAAFIEDPIFRPMIKRDPKTGITSTQNMGVAGAGAFGKACGIAYCALVASGCSIEEEVRPGVWDRAIGLKGGPDDARRMAQNRWPHMAALFARVRDDGRADASLIGVYGVQKLNRGRIAA
jgi:crossover junction endodeoxyribonuclease RuvC